MDVSLNRTLIKLPSFVGSMSANSTATLAVPASGTYYMLTLFLTTAGVAMTQANMESMVSEIRIKINGRVQRTIKPRHLIRVNNFHGRPFQAGFLNIFFAEPWRTHDVGEDALAWGMGDVASFQIEVDFAAAAVTPNVYARAAWTPRTSRIGAINKWRYFTMAVSAIGVYNWLPPRDESIYAFHADTTNLSNVIAKLDQNIIIEASKLELDDYYENRGGLIPQTDMTHVDLTMLTGRFDDLLALVRRNADGSIAEVGQDLRVDWTTTTNATFVVLAETVGLPW